MENEPLPLEAGIYLVGTPIGNMEDITLRALRVLAGVDALACEDTRVTRKLFQRHGLPAPKQLLIANDHTERRVADHLVKLAREGRAVAFCSDAGMPGISDPGHNLVRAAREAGVRVEVIPGPSAVPTAVALAGLAGASFTFLGFPSRRDGRFGDMLAAHGRLPPAMVLYESPRRLGRLFRLAAERIGPDREAAVCLELTKKFERVVRGSVGELAERFAGEAPKGEATVIIAGATKYPGADADDAEEGVFEAEADEETDKEP